MFLQTSFGKKIFKAKTNLKLNRKRLGSNFDQKTPNPPKQGKSQRFFTPSSINYWPQIWWLQHKITTFAEVLNQREGKKKTSKKNPQSFQLLNFQNFHQQFLLFSQVLGSIHKTETKNQTQQTPPPQDLTNTKLVKETT